MPRILYDLRDDHQKKLFQRRLGEDFVTENDPGQAEIVITDSDRSARRMAEAGKFVIGCREIDEGFLDGASLVITSSEDLGPQELSASFNRFLGKPAEILRTERLIIRESSPEDYQALRSMSEEAAGKKIVSVIPEDGYEDYLAYIRTAYRFFGFGLWTVVLKESGKIIGRCGLMPEADEISPDGRIEIGYLISEKDRCRGYAWEACSAILDYAFFRLECPGVYARIDPSNVPSLRLAEKLGLRSSDVRTDGGKLVLLKKEIRDHVKVQDPQQKAL